MALARAEKCLPPLREISIPAKGQFGNVWECVLDDGVSFGKVFSQFTPFDLPEVYPVFTVLSRFSCSFLDFPPNGSQFTSTSIPP